METSSGSSPLASGGFKDAISTVPTADPSVHRLELERDLEARRLARLTEETSSLRLNLELLERTAADERLRLREAAARAEESARREDERLLQITSPWPWTCQECTVRPSFYASVPCGHLALCRTCTAQEHVSRDTPLPQHSDSSTRTMDASPEPPPPGQLPPEVSSLPPSEDEREDENSEVAADTQSARGSNEAARPPGLSPLPVSLPDNPPFLYDWSLPVSDWRLPYPTTGPDIMTVGVVWDRTPPAVRRVWNRLTVYRMQAQLMRVSPGALLFCGGMSAVSVLMFDVPGAAATNRTVMVCVRLRQPGRGAFEPGGNWSCFSPANQEDAREVEWGVAVGNDPGASALLSYLRFVRERREGEITERWLRDPVESPPVLATEWPVFLAKRQCRGKCPVCACPLDGLMRIFIPSA